MSHYMRYGKSLHISALYLHVIATLLSRRVANHSKMPSPFLFLQHNLLTLDFVVAGAI